MPGLGREYMPPLDEGAFLYMPTTMPHASIGQAQEQLAMMDAAIASIPEVEVAVGKLGRAESALDPAPISISALSPRKTALNQMLLSSPRRTLPITWADGATQ